MADFGNYLSFLSHVKLSYRVTTCQTLQLNGHVHCIDVCFVAMNAAKKRRLTKMLLCHMLYQQRHLRCVTELHLVLGLSSRLTRSFARYKFVTYLLTYIRETRRRLNVCCRPIGAASVGDIIGRGN